MPTQQKQDKAISKFRRKPVMVDAVQWNLPRENETPAFGRFCTDHPAVRGTDYMEVHKLLGTSGCSPEAPYWNWSVMGVIDTKDGQRIVTPGDWIITDAQGAHYPCKPEVFAENYEPA
jgi:hypothetical protein